MSEPTLPECNHDWPATHWGVLIGVTVCRKCGKVAMPTDFPNAAEAKLDTIEKTKEVNSNG